MLVVLLMLIIMLMAGIAALFALSMTAARPGNLGVQDSRLAECPKSPNCVCTQSEDSSHWIAPLSFSCPAADVLPMLLSIVSEMPGASVSEEDEQYLRIEFRSRFFRFVDDLEFLVEPESSRVHFRSASRVGYSDLGVNRTRMEEIRRRFMALDRQLARTSQSQDSVDFSQRRP